MDKNYPMIWGVCSKLGKKFDIDPLWLRLGFIISVLAGHGFGLIIYMVLAFLL